MEMIEPPSGWWKQSPTCRVMQGIVNDCTKDRLAVFGVTHDGRGLQEIGTFTWDDLDERNLLEKYLAAKLEEECRNPTLTVLDYPKEINDLLAEPCERMIMNSDMYNDQLKEAFNRGKGA